MCGFAGFININQSKKLDNRSILHEMNKLLYPRGPSDQQILIDENLQLFLAFSRLSIIDLSDAGRQPMVSKSKKSIMMFNGEIYNYKFLKKKYLHDIDLNSNSDSEILIELIEKIGVENALKELYGMFSIFFFDLNSKNLYLIRDRAGEKPLYYCLIKKFEKEIIIFGSDVNAIKKHPDFDNNINILSVNDVLKYGYIKKNKSIYKNIEKITPGSFIMYDIKNNVLLKKKWFNFKDRNLIKLNNNSLNSKFINFEKIFSEVLTDVYNADVNVGVMQSSGIDSTLLTAFYKKKLKKNINTFSIGYYENEYDESDDAKKITDYLKVDHKIFKLSIKDQLSFIIDEIPRAYSEPFADTSQIPSLVLSKSIKKYVSVALTGDGADELFGGYNRYKYFKFLKYTLSLPVNLRKIIFRNQKLIYLLLKKQLFNIDEKIEKFLYYIESKDKNELTNRILSNLTEENKLIKNFNELDSALHSEKYDDLLHNDFENYLPDDILVKNDRAFMYNSIENRSPYLDYRIIEFSNSIPLNQKFNLINSKIFLRKYLNNLIPKKILNNQKKGFAFPISEFMIDNFSKIYELLNSSTIYDIINLNRNEILDITNNFKKNKKNYYLLWNIFILFNWYEKNK
tara:strand:- start:3080 stop:4954 length:1875 start_codon:yes stop_codon:yes gene_type:complete